MFGGVEFVRVCVGSIAIVAVGCCCGGHHAGARKDWVVNEGRGPRVLGWGRSVEILRR